MKLTTNELLDTLRSRIQDLWLNNGIERAEQKLIRVEGIREVLTAYHQTLQGHALRIEIEPLALEHKENNDE